MAKQILAIVGETGSGKSSLAMRMAEEFNGEIICADAWTLRRGMDIGTAKPSKADRSKISHHLLDIIEPNESFNAMQFQNIANEAINLVQTKGKLPILVGGSGLYIDSVLYNYSFSKTDTEAVRDDLNELSNESLLSIIKEKGIPLGEVDIKNKRRLVRLIETDGKTSTTNTLRKGALIIGLKVDPQVLRVNLTSRLDSMIKAGLEQEVKELSLTYGWNIEALKGIGYREWQDYFNETISEPELEERIINDSLYLAKKQRTWFKRNKDINWITTPVKWNEIVDLITTIPETQV